MIEKIESEQKIDSETSKKKLFCVSLDLSDLKSVENFVKEFEKLELGRLDCVVNNAGIMALPVCVCIVCTKSQNKIKIFLM